VPIAEIGCQRLAASVKGACGALGCAEAHPYNIAVRLTAEKERKR